MNNNDTAMQNAEKSLFTSLSSGKVDKNVSWNKIDKTHKRKFIKEYAKKHSQMIGKPDKCEHIYNVLIQGLKDNRLNKTRDVMYDKEKEEITNIPSLDWDAINSVFYLKSDISATNTSKKQYV
jgi:hypothetical protein